MYKNLKKSVVRTFDRSSLAAVVIDTLVSRFTSWLGNHHPLALTTSHHSLGATLVPTAAAGGARESSLTWGFSRAHWARDSRGTGCRGRRHLLFAAEVFYTVESTVTFRLSCYLITWPALYRPSRTYWIPATALIYTAVSRLAGISLWTYRANDTGRTGCLCCCRLLLGRNCNQTFRVVTIISDFP